MSETLEIGTPHGPARAHLELVPKSVAALILGHGAGGGVRAGDLVAAASVAREQGFSVALVEQPYRVAGKRATPRAPVLDEGWLAVVAALSRGALAGLPLVTGGRSSGARVACRTALAAGAAAVLCLAFPLHPPGRGDDPTRSRLPELDGAGVPVLVVQGVSDPFGMPRDGPQRQVVRVPGDHSLRNAGAVAEAVAPWLAVLKLSALVAS